MKILLIGEYSRLHNSLKEGLQNLGHQVTLIGTGDGFKNFPVDIKINARTSNKRALKPLVKVLDKFFKINLIQLEIAYKFHKKLSVLKDFDVVQLINENSIRTTPKLEIWLLKKLFKQNDKLFLLSCGTDYMSVKYAQEKQFRYSILTPLHENINLKKQYQFILKYLKPNYKKLHDYLYKKIKGVIASDMDYHIPLRNHPKYLGLIPNPINIDNIEFKSLNTNGKIKIFHGINSKNYLKKGNLFFEEALNIIKEKYSKKIEIIETTDLPYKTYIEHYNDCHILLDQVYAYDQGYNALEAMAKGKVVFTGAEQEWLDYYNLEENTVAINALPDAEKIANTLEWLILNPNKIVEISKSARAFVEKEHDYRIIAKKYLDVWSQ